MSKKIIIRIILLSLLFTVFFTVFHVYLHYSSEAKHIDQTFENAKLECEAIGYKKGTEKFGECVLDLPE